MCIGVFVGFSPFYGAVSEEDVRPDDVVVVRRSAHDRIVDASF